MVILVHRLNIMPTTQKLRNRLLKKLLELFQLDDEKWKVRLIEEEFMKRMWEVEG
jgi:hypothetical protein